MVDCALQELRRGATKKRARLGREVAEDRGVGTQHTMIDESHDAFVSDGSALLALGLAARKLDRS